MHSVQFGYGPDYLILRIHSRVYADRQDYWEGNWLRCTAQVSAGTFRGTFEWQLRNEDLIRFMNSLEGLDGHSGVASLETLDDWLDVQITRDDQNQIEAQCQVVDDPVSGNPLEFCIPLDET